MDTRIRLNKSPMRTLDQTTALRKPRECTAYRASRRSSRLKVDLRAAVQEVVRQSGLVRCGDFQSVTISDGNSSGIHANGRPNNLKVFLSMPYLHHLLRISFFPAH